MDWIYCVIGGLSVGVLCLLATFMGRLADECKRGGAYKRGQGRD